MTDIDKEEALGEKKVNAKNNLIFKAITGLVSVIAGLALGSAAFVSDGINSFFSLSQTLTHINKKWLSLAVSTASAAASLWLTLVFYFEMSMTVGYLSQSASLFVLPLISGVFIAKATIFCLTAEKSACWIKAELKNLFFDAGVSALAFIAVMLSYLIDFYYEPAVGAALCVYIIGRYVTDTVMPLFSKKTEEKSV